MRRERKKKSDRLSLVAVHTAYLPACVCIFAPTTAFEVNNNSRFIFRILSNRAWPGK